MTVSNDRFSEQKVLVLIIKCDKAEWTAGTIGPCMPIILFAKVQVADAANGVRRTELQSL